MSNPTTPTNDGADNSRDGNELNPSKRVKLDDDNEEKVKDIDIATLIKDAESLSISSISSNYIGKCITIKGNVIRIETTKEVCTKLAFKCMKCYQEFTVDQKDCTFTQPMACETDECDGKAFEPAENNDLTQLEDQRRIRIQEVRYTTDIKIDAPGNIDCILSNLLCDKVSAGESLTVTGVLKLNEAAEKLKKASSHQHNFYLKVFNVKNDKSYEKSSEGEIFFSQKDLEAIKEIENYKDELFRFLVHSIAPCIYGYELIKAGILLSLFGGNSEESEKSLRRNNIHMLIVGDPGMGKSQLLKTVKEVAPRGVYLAGGTSTVAGLTVTMVKDGDGYAIEAGALMMADEGVCCIDEFDKMDPPQHSALLETMEQQSISIAKAGVFRTFSARATVIAAANPAKGHFDRTRTVSENIKINPALLSRFDLTFILRDNPNRNMDLRTSEYLLETEGIRSFRSDSFSNVPEDQLPLIERLKYKRDGEVREIDPLPSILMRKYIMYARQNIHPKTSPEAGEIIKAYYQKLRGKHQLEFSTPVTIRQFESLVRLAEARAKMELREIVTSKDAQDIIEIFEYGMMGVYDDDSDVRASQLIETTQNRDAAIRVKSKSHTKNLFSALQSSAERLSKSIFTYEEIKAIGSSIGLSPISIQQAVDKLNIEGALIKSAPKVYKLTSLGY